MGDRGTLKNGKNRVTRWLLVPLVLAAVIAELVLPLPSWMLLRCLLLGAVVGLLWTPRIDVLSWIGLGVMLLGSSTLFQPHYRTALTSGEVWQSRWDWERPLVTWGVVALVAFAPAMLRRLRNRADNQKME